jgi:hypothetical protein
MNNNQYEIDNISSVTTETYINPFGTRVPITLGGSKYIININAKWLPAGIFYNALIESDKANMFMNYVEVTKENIYKGYNYKLEFFEGHYEIKNN